MNMTMTNHTDAGMMMMMIPFLHFTGGDYLLFEAWRPTSGGAIAGACIGVCVFAMFERWVHSVSLALIRYLVQRKSRNYTEPESKGRTPSPHRSTALPFIASVDIPRGVIYAFQRLLGCVLMLILMTFQLGYLISIIVGLTLGEILFGRVTYGVVKDDQ